MGTAKRLGLIALGYGFAVACGVAAVAANEMRISSDVQQASGGMVAFGDVVLFLLAGGFVGLIPSWFLLRLLLEKAPAAVVIGELILAALGPLSWLGVVLMATAPRSSAPQNGLWMLVGPIVALAAIPRIVFGPVLMVIEAITVFSVRPRPWRGLLALAILMDLIPIGLFAIHMVLVSHGL